MHTCSAVRAQAADTGLGVEHVVVADGHCDGAAQVAKAHGARYVHLEKHVGLWGAACKDLGIAEARGEYVAFWDDDNVYHPHALAVQYATAKGFDIGVNNVSLRERDWHFIPGAFDGHFVQSHIDTACVCVRREVAGRAKWADHKLRDNDFSWLRKLCNPVKGMPSLKINFVPIAVAKHI